jgi:hypothetical protein
VTPKGGRGRRTDGELVSCWVTSVGGRDALDLLRAELFANDVRVWGGGGARGPGASLACCCGNANGWHLQCPLSVKRFKLLLMELATEGGGSDEKEGGGADMMLRGYLVGGWVGGWVGGRFCLGGPLTGYLSVCS